MADLDRRRGRVAQDRMVDRDAFYEPEDWEHLSRYLGQADEAWRWGYCDAGFRRRLHALCVEVAAERADPAQIDQLLMAWQVLRGFPLEYPLPATA